MRPFGKILLAVLLGVLVGGSLVIYGLHRAERRLFLALGRNVEELRSTLGQGNLLDKNVRNEIGNIQSNLARFSSENDQSVVARGKYSLQNFLPSLKAGGEAFRHFQSLVGNFFELSAVLEAFQENVLAHVSQGKGSEIISAVERVRDILNNIHGEERELSRIAARARGAAPGDLNILVPTEFDVQKFSILADTLLAWLKSPSSHRLVIFLYNTAEIRPTGGFIGSYADVAIRGGAIERMDIRDINDPDRELTRRIIPPAPLQITSRRWGAADANWFFDFRDSARKALTLLEASESYKKDDVAFEGAIAMTPKVVQDVLELTGPLVLERSRTLTSKNFLYEIQEEVQEAQAAKKREPKEILREAAPLLLQKVAKLDRARKEKLFLRLEEWLKEKDLMAYFTREDFQKFFESYGWAGRPLLPSASGSENYAAVVRANVGGGKTDTLIKEAVTLESRLREGGVVENRLVLIREHAAGSKEPWWRRTANLSYIKIFVPPDAKIEEFEGGIAQKITPRAEYAKGYEEDDLIKSIEATRREYVGYPNLASFEESGRKVFAAWSKIAPGEKATIRLGYTNKIALLFQEGQTYEFFFDKQAGSTALYRFRVQAPAGFVWKESGSPLFEYETDDPPGRFHLALTLRAI